MDCSFYSYKRAYKKRHASRQRVKPHASILKDLGSRKNSSDPENKQSNGGGQCKNLPQCSHHATDDKDLTTSCSANYTRMINSQSANSVLSNCNGYRNGGLSLERGTRHPKDQHKQITPNLDGSVYTHETCEVHTEPRPLPFTLANTPDSSRTESIEIDNGYSIDLELLPPPPTFDSPFPSQSSPTLQVFSSGYPSHRKVTTTV